MKTCIWFAAVLSFICSTAVASPRDDTCQALVDDRSKNGLYAVLENGDTERLRSQGRNRIDYLALDYFLYVFNKNSRFNPSGPGTDVVVAKTQTVANSKRANKVLVRRTRFPDICRNKQNLFNFPDGQKLVALDLYVKHHGQRYRSRDRNFSNRLRNRFHFKVTTRDNRPTCIWTDGWGEKTANGRTTDTVAAEVISEMFSFEEVNLGVALANRFNVVTSTLAEGAEPAENPNRLQNEYSSLETSLIWVEKARTRKKGCFFIEKPQSTHRGFLGFGSNSDWDPTTTWLVIERWQTKSKHHDIINNKKAKIRYLLRWQKVHD